MEPPYDNLIQLADLLHVTIRRNDSQVEEISEAFFQMKKNVIRFTDSLMRLVSLDQADKKMMEVKPFACLMLLDMIEDIKEEETFLSAKDFVLESILKTINSRSVLLMLKHSLQKSLNELYKVDINQELRNKTILFIKENLKTGSLNEYQASYVIFQCIIGSNSSNTTIADYFNNIQEEFVASASKLVIDIKAGLKEALPGDPEEKSSDISTKLKTLLIWTQTLNSVLNKVGRKTQSKELPFECIQTICGYMPIVEVLSTILDINIPTKQIPQGPLNKVKSAVLKFINNSLRFINNVEMLKDSEINKVYAFSFHAGRELVLQNLFAFCESPVIDIETSLEDPDFEEYVVECLTLLNYLTAEKDFYNIFANFYQRLFVNVCLPLMRSRPSELEKFELYPQEFVDYGVDVCNEQESGLSKSEAAKLLENLCDNIDGAATFLMTVVLGIMECSLAGENITPEMAEKYKVLEGFKGSVFISGTEPKIQMETCILSIAVISYIVYEREDLVESLEVFLMNYREFFFTDKADVLIRCRMCLLVDYYFGILFRKQALKDMSAFMLSFVVQCVTLEDKELRVLSEQGIYVLSHIFKTDTNRSRLGPYVAEIIPRLAAYTEHAQNNNFFSIISEIFGHFRKHLLNKPELVEILIEGLVKRLLISYPDRKPPKATQKAIVSSIWNIITDVANNSRFIPEYQYNIEKVMEPLFLAVQNNDKKVQFESDVLYYVEIVTRRSRDVSPSCWSILKCYPKIFARCKGLLTSLLPSLNQIIINGKEILSKDPDSVSVIIDMGLQGLKPEHSKATEPNTCEAALLLQLIFQYLSPAIPNETWEKIIITCLEHIDQAEKPYVQIKLGGVILSAFLANFQLTYLIVQNQGRMAALLNLFIDEASSYEYAYDRKLLLLGLSSFILDGFKDPIVFERKMDIVNILISFLKFGEILEKKDNDEDEEEKSLDEEDKFLTVPKKILGEFLENIKDEQMQNIINSVNMGLENEDQRDGVDPKEQQEMKEIMEAFTSDINGQDEFTMFKKAVKMLNDTHKTTLLELLENFPENKKRYLKEVCRSERVVVDVNGQDKVRKIVKTKGRKPAANVSLPNQEDHR